MSTSARAGVGSHADPEAALDVARAHGAVADRWVNSGMVGDGYGDARGWNWLMARAPDGFLSFDCEDDLAARLRTEIAVAGGAGYALFEFDTFDVELFYAGDRVAAELGYEPVEVTVEEFLAALPDVPPGPRMYGRPRRAIVIPPSGRDAISLRAALGTSPLSSTWPPRASARGRP